MFLLPLIVSLSNTPDRALEEMYDFGFHRFCHPSMEKSVRSLPERLQSDATLKAAFGN